MGAVKSCRGTCMLRGILRCRAMKRKGNGKGEKQILCRSESIKIVLNRIKKNSKQYLPKLYYVQALCTS